MWAFTRLGTTINRRPSLPILNAYRQSSKKGPLPGRSWTKNAGEKRRQANQNKIGQKDDGRFGRAAVAAGQVALAGSVVIGAGGLVYYGNNMLVNNPTICL